MSYVPRTGARRSVGWIAACFVLGSTACGSDVVSLEKSQANPLDVEESALFGAVNELRSSSGLPTVAVCRSLNAAASQHADDMRDLHYLDDDGKDGSAPLDRACSAGYTAACGSGTGMAELVASGTETGPATLEQWTNDPVTNALVFDGTLIVGGIGRSLGGDAPVWTFDLAASADPSCDE
jgi:uncharacterized protein YkwD